MWNGTNYFTLQLIATIDNDSIDEDSLTEITIIEEKNKFEYDNLFECQWKVYDLNNFNVQLLRKE